MIPIEDSTTEQASKLNLHCSVVFGLFVSDILSQSNSIARTLLAESHCSQSLSVCPSLLHIKVAALLCVRPSACTVKLNFQLVVLVL